MSQENEKVERNSSSLREILTCRNRSFRNIDRDKNEWFGEMDNISHLCSPRGPKQVLDGKYLIILSDIYVTEDERQIVLNHVVSGRAYKTIPVVEVDCDETRAAKIGKLPWVRHVLPAIDITEQIRPIANGIDFLASVAELQRNGLPNDTILIGGRTNLKSEKCPYPSLNISDQGMEVHQDFTANWITEPAIMPVLNLSLGTHARDYPFSPTDIVNLATWGAAHQQLVVMSAGNCGYHEEVETMSAWAQAPWVLSVGATHDAEGTTLAEYSSRGHPSDPNSGPDLVTWGQCIYSQSENLLEGTSFAAPKVSMCALICAAAILQLRHAAQVILQQKVEGVRLVGLGFVDSYGDEIFLGGQVPRIDLPALPVTGVNFDNLSKVILHATERGFSINVLGNESILRQMLLSAARPIEGYEKHEIGAGFLNELIIVDYLGNLRGNWFLENFASGGQWMEVLYSVRQLPIFHKDSLIYLVNIIRQTAPIWKFDWRRQTWGDRLVVNEQLDELLSQDQQKSGIDLIWPPNQKFEM